MPKLANKVALVTGGSRGIGAAIAKRLSAEGVGERMMTPGLVPYSPQREL